MHSARNGDDTAVGCSEPLSTSVVDRENVGS
jgi:hypothetical protein